MEYRNVIEKKSNVPTVLGQIQAAMYFAPQQLLNANEPTSQPIIGQNDVDESAFDFGEQADLEDMLEDLKAQHFQQQSDNQDELIREQLR